MAPCKGYLEEFAAGGYPQLPGGRAPLEERGGDPLPRPLEGCTAPERVPTREPTGEGYPHAEGAVATNQPSGLGVGDNSPLE